MQIFPLIDPAQGGPTAQADTARPGAAMSAEPGAFLVAFAEGADSVPAGPPGAVRAAVVLPDHPIAGGTPGDLARWRPAETGTRLAAEIAAQGLAVPPAERPVDLEPVGETLEIGAPADEDAEATAIVPEAAIAAVLPGPAVRTPGVIETAARTLPAAEPAVRVSPVADPAIRIPPVNETAARPIPAVASLPPGAVGPSLPTPPDRAVAPDRVPMGESGPAPASVVAAPPAVTRGPEAASWNAADAGIPVPTRAEAGAAPFPGPSHGGPPQAGMPQQSEVRAAPALPTDLAAPDGPQRTNPPAIEDSSPDVDPRLARPGVPGATGPETPAAVLRPALAAEGDLVPNRRDARSIRAAQPADLPPPAGPGVRAEATATPVAATPPAQDGAATDPTRAIASSGEPGISETTARGDAPVSDRPLADAPRSAAPAPQLAEAPRPAMRTMAEALHRSADGAVELTLSPEELGRVRLTLAPGEHGITVTINAERGDTLELMRRHADLLGNAMRELGYGEVVLDFRGKGARQGPAPGSLAIAGAEGEDGAPNAALGGTPSRRAAASGGLDLRL